ncbi:MAG: alanine/glycine:cation symporter family protein [Myxococcota bacterium]|nr:alanine/glycine:cation symporter family protein [Myxococcota bacterium]
MLFLLSFLCTPAFAEEEESFFKRMDDAFGKHIVGNLGKYMFYDIAFWDNHLKMGELSTKPLELTLVKNDQKKKAKWDVFAYQDGKYELFEHVELNSYEVTAALEEPLERKNDIFSWSVAFEQNQLVAKIPETIVPELELELTPIAEWKENTEHIQSPTQSPSMERFITTKIIEGLPIIVERPIIQEAELIEGIPEPAIQNPEPNIDSPPYSIPSLTILLPSDYLPVEVGGFVYGDGRLLKVKKIDGEKITAQGLEKYFRDKELPNPNNIVLPAVVVWLVLGAIFFTFRMMFINLRGFVHAIHVTAGKYDHDDDEGEVSHFQALSSALSATVGLGNIAGVAVAVSVGGPGAIVWMVIAGFLGMSSKFVECTLGQMYRKEDGKGQVSGGPMRYLHEGLSEMKLGALGRVLSVVFALMCIGGSLGGGNMFQSNQSFAQVASAIPFFAPKATGEVVFSVDRQALQSPISSEKAKKASKDSIVIPIKTKLTASKDGKTFDYITTQTVEIAADQSQSAPVLVRAIQASEDANVTAGSISSITAFAYGGLKEEKAQIGTALKTVFHEGALSVDNPTEFSGGGEPKSVIYGLFIAILVGMVILGGIKSIGKVAGLIVPLMCALYVLACLYILSVNASDVPKAFATMFEMAFATESVYGGFIGALIQGFRRAAFSNEAGVGSASIAHSAAATNEPVREGIVALLEPFIDTILICTMTGLVVVITGVYTHPDLQGVELTSLAFGSAVSWFPMLLSIAVFFFAFSTMISWSYYGERCTTYLFGEWASLPYKIIFLVCVVFGAIFQLGNVLDFSDLMVLGMAFPNILGLFILSGKVKIKLDDYWGRLQSGEMKRTR